MIDTRTLQNESSHEEFINLSTVVAPSVVITRDGDLITTYKVKGISFETVDDLDIDRATKVLNTLYRSISRSDFSVQIHRLRRPIKDQLTPCIKQGFAHELSSRYNKLIGQSCLMSTELYISLIMKKRKLVKTKTKRTSLEQIKHELEEKLEEFEKVANIFEKALSKFDVQRLGEYKEKDKFFSEQLAFYNFLLTGVYQKVMIPSCPVYMYLGNCQIFVGSDVIELQSINGRQFVQCIELKDFTQATTAGILDGLLYPDIQAVKPYTFVETQSFCFLSKNEGQKFLQVQQKQLLSSNDAGVRQIEAMTAAIDGVVNGDFSIGEYSYTCVVYGNDLVSVKKNTADVIKKLQEEGFLPFVSTLALASAFYSQLPANFAFRPRIARITSVNFSHLAPLHNFGSGKRNGNPWGEALALLKTPSDQPYYFNFHTSPAGENSFDKKTLANTTVIGTSGSGKTVLLTFLLAMAQKYRNDGSKMSVIFFDKDRGAELAIRAMDGGYLSVKNGLPTGFNPFQLEDTEENIQFLISFVKLILSMDKQPIKTYEELNLTEAVRAVMAMPKKYRRLGLVPQYLVEGTTREERENSLSKRLTRWIEGGDLAWVFDNVADDLDFEKYPNFGIDGTEFLDNAQVRTPIAYYLLYRMEQIIDGRRFIFFMDEFWKWLLDEAFSDFAFNKLKTIRKQNGFGVFATQSPSDVMSSPIAKAVIEQSATQIFLPNPKADADDYLKGFKVTPQEFEIISSLAEDSRMMLIKQGHVSVIAKLDLSSFKNELKVLSGSTDNILWVQDLIELYGSSPSKWLPHFFGGTGTK